MRIGLDIDGVVADFSGTINAAHEWWFGEPSPIVWDEWTAYKQSPHFPTWADCQQWADKALLWATMPFVNGAPAGIDGLLAAGHDLVFLTARTGKPCVDQTMFWFDRQITQRWPELTHRKLYTHLGGNKQAIGCAVYVDDSSTELKALQDAGKKTIRFAAAWNAKHKGATKVVNSWADVVSAVGEIE